MSTRTLYRVQATTGDGWVTQFEPTASAARKTHAALLDVYDEARIDEVTVETSREGLCLALNHADVNHIWWGDRRVDR